MKKDRSSSKSRVQVLVELQSSKEVVQDNVNMCLSTIFGGVVYSVHWRCFSVYDLKETEIIGRFCTNGSNYE